jgi:hypothetical protein
VSQPGSAPAPRNHERGCMAVSATAGCLGAIGLLVAATTGPCGMFMFLFYVFNPVGLVLLVLIFAAVWFLASTPWGKHE